MILNTESFSMYACEWCGEYVDVGKVVGADIEKKVYFYTAPDWSAANVAVENKVRHRFCSEQCRWNYLVLP